MKGKFFFVLIIIILNILFFKFISLYLNNIFRHKLRSIQVNAQTVSPTPDPNDWPQLQHDPQRSGHSTEAISTPISQSWAVGFATTFAPSYEKLYPQVQPVIVGGKVFIGSEMGTFYALNSTTGAKLWQYPPQGQPRIGPILSTAGVENNLVFFATLDGNIYALNVLNGALAWKYSAGISASFSSSILLAEGNIFIPTRSGTYYALAQNDGHVVWQKDIGVPIFMSSAYNLLNGKGQIYFGGMDMRVYAISSSDGSIIWQSNPVPGAAFKDYWPVVDDGYVFIRPYRVEGGTITASQSDQSTWSLFIFAENSITPAQLVWMPHAVGITMNGATCPPSADKTGKLVTAYLNGWRILDPVAKAMTSTSPSIGGNPDENVCSSTAGDYAVIMHTQEGNAQWTGVWNMATGATTQFGAYSADYLCGGVGCFWNNTQGGGTSPAAVANGIIFHNTQNTLNARKAILQ